MMGLAESTKWLDDAAKSQAREAIEDSARGESMRYCITAARALVTLGDTSAAGFIEGMARRLAPQWQPMFGKCAQALRGQAKSVSDSLSNEALLTTVRKLTDRVESLEAKLEAKTEDKGGEDVSV